MSGKASTRRKDKKATRRKRAIRVPAKVGHAITILKATGASQAVLNAYMRGVQDTLKVPTGWVLDATTNLISPPENKKKRKT